MNIVLLSGGSGKRMGVFADGGRVGGLCARVLRGFAAKRVVSRCAGSLASGNRFLDAPRQDNLLQGIRHVPCHDERGQLELLSCR